MGLERVALEHMPPTHAAYVAVYRDVDNAEFLQQQLLRRNRAFEYAFIDAGCIVSRFHLLSAVYKAVSAQAAGCLRTPNVHSEIVCSLSPANNISEAYRRHGITASSKAIVVVKALVSSAAAAEEDEEEAIRAHLASAVRGTTVPFTDEALGALTDWARVRRCYRLEGLGWVDAIADAGARARELEMLVVTAMALRGV